MEKFLWRTALVLRKFTLSIIRVGTSETLRRLGHSLDTHIVASTIIVELIVIRTRASKLVGWRERLCLQFTTLLSNVVRYKCITDTTAHPIGSTVYSYLVVLSTYVNTTNLPLHKPWPPKLWHKNYKRCLNKDEYHHSKRFCSIEL